jgi:hypothetical protein
MRGVIARKEISNFPFKALVSSFFDGLCGFAVFFILSILTRFLDSILYDTKAMEIESWDFILGLFCFALVFSYKFLDRRNKNT